MQKSKVLLHSVVYGTTQKLLVLFQKYCIKVVANSVTSISTLKNISNMIQW